MGLLGLHGPGDTSTPCGGCYAASWFAPSGQAIQHFVYPGAALAHDISYNTDGSINDYNFLTSRYSSQKDASDNWTFPKGVTVGGGSHVIYQLHRRHVQRLSNRFEHGLYRRHRNSHKFEDGLKRAHNRARVSAALLTSAVFAPTSNESGNSPPRSSPIPAIMYQPIKAATDAGSDEVWAKHWAACNIDRALEMCAKREISAQIVSILRTLDNPLIVDAGCGVGTWVQYFRNQGLGNIVGVDSFLPALQILTERGGRGVEGDIRHLPFESDSVDAFLSFGVIEHFPENPTGCLREMHRALVPGGYLFLTVPYNSWMRRLLAHPARRVYRQLKGGNREFFEYRFRESEILEFCRNSGSEVLNCTTDDYMPNNMSLGLWLDIPLFRGGEPGELNKVGAVFCRLLRSLSPWLISSGVFVIARKPSASWSRRKLGEIQGG